MTKQEQLQFIEMIATYISKYRKQYGIELTSVPVAQACMESGFGTSELAKNCLNIFGMKFRKGRCKTAYDTPYNKVGSEQNPDGSYVSSEMKWFKFPTVEAGCIGYLDFINVSNYKALKGEKDYKQYIMKLKQAGYWTSLDYHERLIKFVEDWNLTKYDREVETAKSDIVDLVMISPNSTNPRKNPIDTITIHHTAGELTAKRIGEIFSTKSRGASCNYGVGCDGKVVKVVEEENRSWCSSTGNAKGSNDHRAITLEVSNNTNKDPWTVSDLTLRKTIELVADICKRNNIEILIWDPNKNNRINRVNGANMTLHKDFAATACPGPYLESKMGYIADEVNKILGGQVPQQTSEFVYVVQRGDTLAKIAQRYGTTYQKIAIDNKIANPNLIITGQKLVIRR